MLSTAAWNSSSRDILEILQPEIEYQIFFSYHKEVDNVEYGTVPYEKQKSTTSIEVTAKHQRKVTKLTNNLGWVLAIYSYPSRRIELPVQNWNAT